jgi:hypothetical protein
MRVHDAAVDAQVGNALIEVKFAADALRTVRTGLMQLAYAMNKQPSSLGYLVLVHSGITAERLRQEWEKAKSVLNPQIARNITLCLKEKDGYLAIPDALTPELKAILDDVVARERSRGDRKLPRPDYALIICKILLNHWATSEKPITADRLAQIAGCSYPTVARALSQLGSLVERTSDRRISLRYFPKDIYFRLAANSDKFRASTRYSDSTGQSRTPEKHLKRLENLDVPGLAVGGVFGARHYYHDLNLVGTPRLDLSLHAYHSRASLEFMTRLDPALRIEPDPVKPANLVVHFVQQKDPLFTPRREGLFWADPLDCMLDLQEAKLDQQALQFLNAIERRQVIAT